MYTLFTPSICFVFLCPFPSANCACCSVNPSVCHRSPCSLRIPLLLSHTSICDYFSLPNSFSGCIAILLMSLWVKYLHRKGCQKSRNIQVNYPWGHTYYFSQLSALTMSFIQKDGKEHLLKILFFLISYKLYASLLLCF